MSRRWGGDGLGASNLENRWAKDESEALAVVADERRRKRSDRSQRAKDAIERKKQAKVTLPTLKWMRDK
jgi:hypothetical protein